MLKKHEVKSMAAIAMPLMAAFLAQKGMHFIDTMMMGWIGSAALAAGALGTSLYWTLMVFCIGTLSAVGIFIARAKGENNDQEIKTSLLHGCYLVVMLSIPTMLVLWFAPEMLKRIGEDPAVVDNTKLLLHGLTLGVPGYLFFILFRDFASAFGKTRVVMWIAMSSLPLTFLANYIFIYGKFGLPQLGVAGIGYSGAVIMWFMCLCGFLYCKKHPQLKPHLYFESYAPSCQKLSDMLHIGLPSGMLFILESGMFLLAAIMMGYFGVANLAAHQIAMQWASIAYSIPFSLAMATSFQVGHAVGAKDMLLAKRHALSGLLLGLIGTLFAACVFILLPNTLVNIFLKTSNHQDIAFIPMASSFLLVAAFFQCFDGFQSIANGALRGMRDTIIPMLLSIACYWIIGIGSGYYFSFHTKLGAIGIWYGLTLGISTIGIILLFRLGMKLNHMQNLGKKIY